MTNSKIPARIAAMTVELADEFYAGTISSADAFAKINAAARSAWNYYDGIFTDTHRMFDARVSERIDADVDSWATGCPNGHKDPIYVDATTAECAVCGEHYKVDTGAAVQS